MWKLKYWMSKRMYLKKWIIGLFSLLFVGSMAAIITTSILFTQVKSTLESTHYLENELINKEFVEPLQAPRPNYSSQDVGDALLVDAKQKANTDSVLIYYIGWFAVFHKFGFLSHIISILEINPTKEIHIFVEKNTFDLNFLANYKNIKISYIETNWPTLENIDNEILWSGEFLNQINNLSINRKIDFYLSDLTLIEGINIIMSTNELSSDIKNKIINQFSGLLYKTDSINLFSDGTLSSTYYGNDYFKLFAKTDNAYSTFENDYALNQKYYNKYKDLVASNTLVNIDTYTELFYFLISPIVTKNKSNNFQKTKFFHTSINAVIDVNDNLDKERLLTKSPNNYFDPYNSLNAGLIKLIQSFTQNQQSQLLGALKANVQTLSPNNVEFNFMNNALSLVYSGRLLGALDEQGMISECQKIIDLYNEAKIKYPNKNIQILFKPHPRDKEDSITLATLKEWIAKITGNDINNINWIFTINKDIPFELYLACNVFFDLPAKNREVKIYTTFSTVALMLYDYNQNMSIENFLLSQKENTNINLWYGTNSTIFAQNKRKIY